MASAYSYLARRALAVRTAYLDYLNQRLVGRAFDGLGGVVNTASGPFPAGWVFPSAWLSKNIKLHLLLQFCTGGTRMCCGGCKC